MSCGTTCFTWEWQIRPFRIGPEKSSDSTPCTKGGWVEQLHLYGNDGNDILDGGAGGDTLSGGAGTDIAVWHLPRASYKTISLADSSYAVVYDGTDSQGSPHFEAVHSPA